MKKTLVLLLSFFIFFSNLYSKQSIQEYRGFGLGGYGNLQLPMGDWQKLAVVSLGGEINLEYILPRFLPNDLDMGLSTRLQFNHVFAQNASNLKRDTELIPSFGLFLRIPFTYNGIDFAFQPELAYAYAIHYAEGRNKAKVNSCFCDSSILISAGLRWKAPLFNTRTLEFEIAPLYIFSIEEKNYCIHQFGYRVGIVWHFQNYISEYYAKLYGAY